MGQACRSLLHGVAVVVIVTHHDRDRRIVVNAIRHRLRMLEDVLVFALVDHSHRDRLGHVLCFSVGSIKNRRHIIGVHFRHLLLQLVASLERHGHGLRDRGR